MPARKKQNSTPPHLMETKDNHLQDILDQKKISRAKAASLAGISVEVINRVLEGRSIRREKFLALAAGLDAKPSAILPSWDRQRMPQ